MNYENTARVINDDIFDLINQCFDEERSSRNNEARLNFFDYIHLQVQLVRHLRNLSSL